MIAPGTRVMYAGAPYEVVSAHGGLLTLVGVAYQIARRVWRARVACTVLASDVTVLDGEGES